MKLNELVVVHNQGRYITGAVAALVITGKTPRFTSSVVSCCDASSARPAVPTRRKADRLFGVVINDTLCLMTSESLLLLGW